MSLAPPSDNRWGCIGCGCATLAILLYLGPYLLILSGPPRTSYTSSCLSNVKQLSTAMRMYVPDYDDQLPPAAAWHDATLPYVKNEAVYVCPKRLKRGTGYAFNQLLGGASVSQSLVPEKTPLIFESNLGQRNGADRLQSFIRPHNKAGLVGFLDGHVKRSIAPPAADAGLKGARE